MDPELPEQVLRVRSHGVYRYSEVFSYGRALMSGGDTGEDLTLSHRQAGELVVEQVRGWQRALHLAHDPTQ
jgi:hypothetical protein